MTGCDSKVELALNDTESSYTIEAQKAGSEFSQSSDEFIVGDSLTLYFKKSDENLTATWSSYGGAGTLTILNDGISATFTATDKGSTEIFAEYNGIQKAFIVNVGNTAPKLDEINNQAAVILGNSILTIDAGELGADVDAEGEALNYSCFYDLTIDNNVNESQSCTDLSGVSFSSSTGILDWITSGGQAGNYEFKIVADDSYDTDSEIFTIEVLANNAPVLDVIANQTGIYAGFAITSIDAGEAGSDIDSDGHTISYSCYYDTTVDSSVASTNLCTTLNGLSFSTSTGILDWNTEVGQVNTYEFIIIANDNYESDSKIFTIEVITNNPPVLDAIANQTGLYETDSITTIDAGVSGADTDVDGHVLTYSCYYDTTVDANVSTTNACTSLSGLSFNTSSGVLDWVTESSQAAIYEISITATDGVSSDAKIFTIEVLANTSPTLDSISNQSGLYETDSISTIDAGVSGSDSDSDGHALAYSCYYDTTVDANVAAVNACSSLSGVSFNTATGILDWTTEAGQANTYEFEITANDGYANDSEIFTIDVLSNTTPTLDSISNQAGLFETDSIVTVDAGVSGSDSDADGQTLTYTCYYDTTVNSTVAESSLCSSISGASFNTSTGVLSWTTEVGQANTYEFKITSNDSYETDSEIFTIEVLTNTTPVLDTISNQTGIHEGSSIATINAGESGGDTDSDGQSLSYTCFYDTNVDSTVTETLSCSSISGVSFSAVTGILDWDTEAGQANTYEFMIIASDGYETDDEIFTIEILTNTPPSLDAISNQTGIYEGDSIATVDAGESGADIDSNGQTLTYSCFYDTTIDAAVAQTTACTTLTGVSFSTTTGVLDWTTSTGQAANYEFSIIATDGADSANVIFTIEILANTLPALDTIADNLFLMEGENLTVDANDAAADVDADGHTLTYSCTYDMVIDDSVGFPAACTDITGLNFNTSTGVLDWTPAIGQSAEYEFKITASDGYGTGDEVFAVKVINSSNMVTKWRIASDGDSITLPILSGYTYNFTVDWGDGNTDTITDFNDTAKSHTYATAGDYIVTISGTMPSWSFNNSGSQNEIIAVYSLGDMDWENLYAAFRACFNLEEFYSGEGANTTNVTDLSYFLDSTIVMHTADLSTMDTSNVTSMRQMFYHTRLLTDLNISNLDTTKVTNMREMFYRSDSLTSLDLSHFYTPQLADMHQMFTRMESLTSLDISNFNTTNVTSMYSLFYQMYSLTSLDLSSFDTSNVTNMYRMFADCRSLTSINLSSFDISSVTNMELMFFKTYNIGSLDLSGFITTSLSNATGMFYMSGFTDLDVSNFDVTNVTTFKDMFRELTGSVDLNLDLSSFGTAASATTINAMFYSSPKIKSINLQNFNVPNAADYQSAFRRITNCDTLNISSMTTAGATSMIEVFEGSSSLTSLNLTAWDTSSVTSMMGMFDGVTSLTTLNLSGFDTSSVTNMSYMFANTSGITNLNLSSFDTSSVTDMSFMFLYTQISNITFSSNFVATNVTTMEQMFRGVTNLTSLDLSSFGTSAVTTIDTMFYQATSLTSINLTNFDTPNLVDIHNFLYGCSSLATLDISNLDTSNTTNWYGAFNGLSSISPLDLSHLDTSAAILMHNIFQDSTIDLNLDGWDITNVTNSTDAFTNYTGTLYCDQVSGDMFGVACN